LGGLTLPVAACDRRYEGEWLGYDMHGRGTFTSAKGWCFAGVLARDRPTHGVLTEADGRCFSVKYSETCETILSKPKPMKKVKMPDQPTENESKARAVQDSHSHAPGRAEAHSRRPRTAPEDGSQVFRGCWVQVRSDVLRRFSKKGLRRIQQRDPSTDGPSFAKDGREEQRNKRTHTFENGSTYVGEWKLGSQHGQGTFNYSDGDR